MCPLTPIGHIVQDRLWCGDDGREAIRFQEIEVRIGQEAADGEDDVLFGVEAGHLLSNGEENCF